MAQHIPVEKIQNKAIQKIVESIKKQRYFRSSFKFQEVEKNIFMAWRSVPQSIVFGGKAGFEVHLNDSGKIEQIYLVA